MKVVVVRYWWMRFGVGSCGDSFYKGGSCNSCRSTKVKVVVVVVKETNKVRPKKHLEDTA